MTADLYVTNGRPRDFQTRQASFCRRAARSSSELHLDPRGAEPLDAATVYERVRVTGADDDAGDSGGDDSVGAGRRAAVVGAGLERH